MDARLPGLLVPLARSYPLIRCDEFKYHAVAPKHPSDKSQQIRQIPTIAKNTGGLEALALVKLFAGLVGSWSLRTAWPRQHLGRVAPAAGAAAADYGAPFKAGGTAGEQEVCRPFSFQCLFLFQFVLVQTKLHIDQEG